MSDETAYTEALAAQTAAIKDQPAAIREWIAATDARAKAEREENRKARLANFVSQTLASLAGSQHQVSDFEARADAVIRLLEHYAAVPSSAQPADPIPTSADPPLRLTDSTAPWYLDQMRDELVRWGLQPTIQAAKDHWTHFGREQGRKWSADSPGWGPAVSKDDPRWAPPAKS